MKKSIITLSLCLATIISFGQTKPEAKKDSIVQAVPEAKKDTIVQMFMHINQYRALLYKIDVNIDSKKETKEVLEFLQKSASIREEKSQNLKVKNQK